MNLKKVAFLLVVAVLLTTGIFSCQSQNSTTPEHESGTVATETESGSRFVITQTTTATFARSTPTQKTTPATIVAPIPTLTSVQGVPVTSASAITSPPPSMVGINTHTEVYGTDADPNIITLGPKLGSHPNYKTYPGKRGMEFELKHGTPLLAPIDMVLIGFSDASANYRIQEGQKNTPYNDLMLWFESASPDWPGMIVFVYHLYSSPLVIGHNQNPDGSEVEEWGSTVQAQGHLFFEFDDSVTLAKGTAAVCEALIGYKVKRGELIGFAGSVGTHSMAPFCFKVSDTSINPTVVTGNRYLHWVQPSSFFYWKSYSPDAIFPSGVLAYPFECDGYQLPAEQRDVSFKYQLNN